MRVKELLTDDDAVSPVIGVILMVAITVILAAVIASFVLGLGDSADEVQPNNSFTFDYTENDTDGGYVTVILSEGEPLEEGNVIIRGEELKGGDTGELTNVGNWSGSDAADNGEWEAGESVDIGVKNGTGTSYVLRVVWEGDNSDDSSTLQTDEGPDA